jgi:hypothetical protein
MMAMHAGINSSEGVRVTINKAEYGGVVQFASYADATGDTYSDGGSSIQPNKHRS